MKWLFALALLVLAPLPKPPAMTASFKAVGTTVRLKWTISATPSDSLTVDATATGQPVTHRRYVVSSKTDSIDYPKPLPGDTIIATLSGKNWRLGRPASGTPFVQAYVEPDTVVVPPTIKGTLTPTSATILQGDSVLFTYRES